MESMRRTDLALELKEDIDEEDLLKGIRIEANKNDNGDISITSIWVEDEEGAKRIGKPIGTYITIESEKLRGNDESYNEEMSDALFGQLVALLEGKKKILIAGLGNREVTPDALGPLVVENLFITRHLKREGLIDTDIELSAISPGVMAQTGMETGEIIRGVVDRINPDVVVVIDALAARNSKRLNSTIQISDTGIAPGSGVGNHRQAITKESMGVKVIAIGVPTVIAVPTIVTDSMDSMLEALGRKDTKKITENFSERERFDLACEILEPYLADMFVTPKNVDEAIKRISFTISEALNKYIE